MTARMVELGGFTSRQPVRTDSEIDAVDAERSAGVHGVTPPGPYLEVGM